MGSRKISLLLESDELENINVHAHSGRNYYQALNQLIYSKLELTPRKNSLADSLIIHKQDYNRYRLQNLARDYGIGFLEDGDEVIALDIEADFEKRVMIEEDEELKERLRIEKLKAAADLGEDYGILLELDDEKLQSPDQ